MCLRTKVILSSVLCALGQGCGRRVNDPSSQPNTELQIIEKKCREPLELRRAQSLMGTYQSCQEIQKDFELASQFQACLTTEYSKLSKQFGVSSAGPVATAQEDSSSVRSANTGDILTNVRDAAVDEADFVKASNSQIFVAQDSHVQVLQRSDKKVLARLDLTESSNQLLVKNNFLVVIGKKVVTVFATSNGQIPTKLSEKTFQEDIIEARLLGERIVILLQGLIVPPEPESTVASISLRSPSGTGSGVHAAQTASVACRNVVRPASFLPVGTQAVTRVESFSLQDLNHSSSRIFLGRPQLYMTEKNIYFFDNSYDQMYRSDSYSSTERAVIGKLSLGTNGALGTLASGVVRGRIKDVWALSELPSGELAVASSSGNLWDGSALNHFSIYSEKAARLEKIAETEDFGAKEDIRSVRFVGQIAYVVTFKKTDPLFAIDVSVPTSPRILGELKIPGFSTYMHPLNEQRLIGLGFDAADQGDFAYYQGLQLSLFDTTNPLQLNRKDVKILGVRGTSSAATQDHRAFYLDPTEQVVGFPLSELKACLDNYACRPQGSVSSSTSKGASTSTSSMIGRPAVMPILNPIVGRDDNAWFSSAVLYKVVDDKFENEKRVTHWDLMSDACRQQSLPSYTWWQSVANTFDVQRIFKLGDELVTISRVGIKSFKSKNLLELSSSVKWDATCAMANDSMSKF